MVFQSNGQKLFGDLGEYFYEELPLKEEYTR